VFGIEPTAGRWDGQTFTLHTYSASWYVHGGEVEIFFVQYDSYYVTLCS